jgi:hypothetical protein
LTARLPAQLEVSALLRQVSAAGGFAMVLKKGEAEAGTILVVIVENGANARVYERMPGLDGTRNWHCAKRQTPDNAEEFVTYLDRRKQQDADLWIVELDIADGERFIGLTPDEG